MKTSENLARAAAVIERNGHHRGGFYNREQYELSRVPVEKCAVCLVGALNLAAGRDPDYTIENDDPALVAVASRLGVVIDPEQVKDGDEQVEAVAYWNDKTAGDTAEVVAVLRAAARAEAEAGR